MRTEPQLKVLLPKHIAVNKFIELLLCVTFNTCAYDLLTPIEMFQMNVVQGIYRFTQNNVKACKHSWCINADALVLKQLVRIGTTSLKGMRL
jgi:hypothetical protein